MLQSLFEQLHVIWQPVMDLHLGTPWGYEACVQGPADSPYASAEALAALARAEDLEADLADLQRALALRSAAQELPESTMVLLQLDPQFADLPLPAADGWPATRTVIEISESSPLFDRPEALQAAIAAWRSEGYHVAFADFGSGFRGAQALVAARPDIVKLDRQLVHGIDRDPWRQEMVSSIVQAASDLGVAVLADGIDDVAELHELVDRRIALGQGPLLGRPVPGAKLSSFQGDWLQSRIDATDLLAHEMQVAGAAYAVDRSRHIVAWNDAAVSMTGYQSQAVVGATCWLSGLDHRDAAGTRLCFGACPLVRAMQSGQPLTEVVSLRTAGGGRKWVQTHVRPVRDANGQVIGAVETFSRAHRPETPDEA